MALPRRTFLLAGACALATLAAKAAEITVIGTPIDLDFGDARRTTAGALTFKGGLRLAGQSPAFGGLSAMRVSPDGKRVLAITDRAAWLQADLQYDGDGMLAGIEHADLSPMIDIDGKSTVAPRSDSESLTIVGNAALVGFERQARVMRFALDGNRSPTSERPTVFAAP